MIASAISASPMWWEAGHQVANDAVKTLNARSTLAATVTDAVTAGIVPVGLLMSSPVLVR